MLPKLKQEFGEVALEGQGRSGRRWSGSARLQDSGRLGQSRRGRDQGRPGGGRQRVRGREARGGAQERHLQREEDGQKVSLEKSLIDLV